MVHPSLEGVEFLQEILYQFGVNNGADTKVKCLHAIQEKMLENLKAGKETLLVIDEAHLLPPAVLEEIRLLLNFQLNDRFLITVILLGQPELLERVKAIQQLHQRIPIKYHLTPFDLNESIQYLLFRQKRAGREDNAFTAEAMERIHEYTEGVPRKINNLSDLSLLIGFCENQKEIKPEIIEKIIGDGTFL
jgi:general secretion pathway protein A